MKSICAPALLLAIPAFLAFQIAAKPLFFCAAKVCDFAAGVMPCESSEIACSGKWDKNVVQGCATKAAKSAPSGCGGCASESKPVRTEPRGGCCADEPEPEPVATGCCSEPSPPQEARGCGGPKTATPISGCPKKSNDENSSDGCCPDGKPVCVICTPARFLAERPSEIRELQVPEKILPVQQASNALAEADHIRALLHAHSPPPRVLARAGPQIKIEQCSFLL